MPGDASPGTHTLTSSCHRSGKPVMFTATFTVTSATIHRSALLTSIPQPRDVSRKLGRVSLSAVIALLLIPLLAFPFQLFNSTLEENYDEVRGWFGLPPKREQPLERARQHLYFCVLLIASGVLYGLLSPDFGLNRTTLVTAVSMAAAVLATGLGFALPTYLFMRERYGDRGHLRVLPGTIIVAGITVGISRLLHFQPGYVYGLIAIFAYRRSLDDETEGEVTTAGSVLILIVTLAAWIARTPVTTVAARPHANVFYIMLEAFLGGVFLMGLESLLVDLLPLRFLDGSRIIRWRKAVWAVLFGLGLFVLVHVLLSPGSGYVGHTKGYSFFVVLALYVGFGAVSVAFWAYFRFRAPKEELEPVSP
jgi:hypothetical protein